MTEPDFGTNGVLNSVPRLGKGSAWRAQEWIPSIPTELAPMMLRNELSHCKKE
jgi:hypothetical protein